MKNRKARLQVTTFRMEDFNPFDKPKLGDVVTTLEKIDKETYPTPGELFDLAYAAIFRGDSLTEEEKAYNARIRERRKHTVIDHFNLGVITRISKRHSASSVKTVTMKPHLEVKRAFTYYQSPTSVYEVFFSGRSFTTTDKPILHPFYHPGYRVLKTLFEERPHSTRYVAHRDRRNFWEFMDNLEPAHYNNL